MAGPAGAALQNTKRGKRYWHLKNSVEAAISLANGQKKYPSDHEEVSAEAPGLLEVRQQFLCF